MPRYRFRWELIPSTLTRELAHQLGLSGPPVDALQRRFGLRPQHEFIRECWPVLRDRWLARDGAWRRFVVQELRNLGLGKRDAEVRTKAQQMDYLASCRNAESLRIVVLAAFHQLGDISQAEIPSALAAAVPSDAPAKPDKVWRDEESFLSDLDDTLAHAWVDFEDRLSRVLARLDAGQVVVLELPSPYRSLQAQHHTSSSRWQPVTRCTAASPVTTLLTIVTTSPLSSSVGFE